MVNDVLKSSSGFEQRALQSRASVFTFLLKRSGFFFQELLYCNLTRRTLY